ncbi:MAG: DUF3422 domain-containing protein [Hyphomicrobiales bacterium]|jgi:uncharacterized membrane-anchored protein|nr:DUF3422 domain-containing protein [Hyphomicrobiales bacterium]
MTGSAAVPVYGDHPARAALLGELHARPFATMDTPRRVLHFAYTTDAGQAASAVDALAAFCSQRSLPAPAANARHHRVNVQGAILRFERHSEFCTYSWEFDATAGADDQPFRPAARDFARLMNQLPQPGPTMVQIDLHLLKAAKVADSLETIFGVPSLAASRVEDNAATLATDFRADPDGYVKLLIIDEGLTTAKAGALVQRALEIETYRTFALLGLPEAQALSPSIRKIELQLPWLMQQMQATEGFEANRKLLSRLTELAGELEGGAAASLFRFGATRAYDELVRLRLDAIGERAVPGQTTLSGFLSRRLAPAIRTCVSTEERQANLSRKLARAAQLLRTRVDIDLESQNQELLRAMNERAQVQLRLQQTVEGLSVAAVSYYVLGLLGYLFKAWNDAGGGPDPVISTALALPLVVIGVALAVRRVRRGHFEKKS